MHICTYIHIHAQVTEDVLTGRNPDYKDVCTWLTENVKDSNFANMLVQSLICQNLNPETSFPMNICALFI